MNGRSKQPERPTARRGVPGRRLPQAWIAGGLGSVALAIAAFVVLVSQRGGDDASGAVRTGVELSSLRTADFHSMAVSPRDAKLILYGHHGGVLRSNDGGRSWTETNLSGETDDAMGIGFAGAGGNVVLAAGHDTFFRSGDAGQTWEDLQTKLPGSDLHGLTTAPGDAATVYVHVVGFGIYSSDDNGVSWAGVGQTALPGDIISLSAASEGRLYAASPGSGILRSDDKGRTFEPVASIDTPLTVSAAASARDIVYVGTQSGLFFSDDSGQRWQSRPLPSAGAVMVTAVNPLDARDIAIVVVGEEGIGRVHRSADGGTTWTAR